MSAATFAGGGGRQAPGNKVGAGVIWLLGAYMTREFFTQITTMEAGHVLVLTAAVQIVLTLAQSPVWRGKGGMISYTALVIDAVINFGGVMFFMANIDQSGSVQSMSVAFMGTAGEWPMFVKGVLALFLSGVIAGLPEFLWKLD